MKKTLLILLFSLLILPVRAAAPNAAKADQYFNEGNYEEALPIYQSLHTATPKNVLYTYRLARCEQETGDEASAITHFEQAGDKYNLRNLYLGDLYYINYRFAEALVMYRNYLNGITPEHERFEEVTEQIRRTERAARMLSRIEDINFTDSVTFPKEQLLQRLPRLTEQGSFSSEHGTLTFCNQRADRRFLAIYDKQSGRSLLCKQEKLLDTWSAPDTLPAIVNRFAMQGYPFLMPDGVTLYYAAMSNQGLGEWDIYVTRYNHQTNTYLTPELLGMPFNSLSNDYLCFFDETAGRGYLVSDRNTTSGHLTLYTFIPKQEKKLLTDSSDVFVRNYARLRELNRQNTGTTTAKPAVNTPKPATTTPAASDSSFALLICDTLVYNSFSAFISNEAREHAEAYLKAEQEIAAAEAETQKLRTEYTHAEEPEKSSIAERILSLEKRLRSLHNDAAAQLLLCRQKEVPALQENNK